VTSCPRCGEPAEPGQLVCTECGNRLSLKEEGGERPSLDRLPAIALLLCVVVIGAGAFGFALSELTDDSKGDSATTADTKTPSTSKGTPQTETETETETGAAQQPSRSLLLEWPKGLTAYTVVIVTSGDKTAAKRVAEEAAKSGLEAGLLKSDDYDLGTNLWIVFAGRFDNQQSAERQAGNLGERYPGAYATLVKPAG
jgi:hypothetical protein